MNETRKLTEWSFWLHSGNLTPKDALDVFVRSRVPGFSFGRWIIGMADEGAYSEDPLDEAA